MAWSGCEASRRARRMRPARGSLSICLGRTIASLLCCSWRTSLGRRLAAMARAEPRWHLCGNRSMFGSKGGPPLAWKIQGLGDGCSSAAISNGRLFIQGQRGVARAWDYRGVWHAHPRHARFSPSELETRPLIEPSIWCPEAFSASSYGSFREPSVLRAEPAPTVRIAEARRLH